MSWQSALAQIADATVRFAVPLAPRTSLRVGGCAEALVMPQSVAAVEALTRLAREWAVPLTVLGGGTNVLVSDGGIPGIVVDLQPGFSDLVEHPEGDGSAMWEVGAGCGTGRVVRLALQRGLRGPEVLAGVPGSMGGALIMNAGGHAGEIESMVQRVRVVHDGAARWLDRDAIGFAYRSSRFPEGAIVLSAELLLVPGDAAALRAQVRAAQARRRKTQPLQLPNAGSIFKNPPGAAAGRLIEAAGCKGWREGGAEVSPLHANFIVNTGGACAADVYRLLRRVQRRVAEHSGALLQLEVRLLGAFDEGGDSA